ncbi:MAG: hypothetical protein K2W95_02010 [Candidatus Obscuribacterales bacterium]|nr:hypothetical protein [Candidatus Obscuribacterales bacterium]
MISKKNSAQSAAALTIIAAVSPSAALAGPYPGTGAPLAVVRKLTPEGDHANPFAYPFLMDIAKSLAKAGLPPGFFLQGDNKTSSAIDLRAILLFEAGILKAPVKLMVPSKKRDDKVPSLSLPAIPDADKQFPGDEKPAVGTSPPATSEATITAPTASSPKLSLDFDRFQLELIKPQNKNELSDPTKQSIAMSFPVKPPATGADSNTFRLWTLRTAGPALATSRGSTATDGGIYQGSFIVAVPGAIKSIEGRLFGLKEGRLLACSRGKPLVLDAARSQVFLSPGSTVALDSNGKGLLELHVLEAGSGSVAVKFKTKGGLEELRLRAGEQLVWSEDPLTPAQRALVSSPLPGPGNHADSWAKGKFSPGTFVEKSQLFKGEILLPNSDFQSAMKSLRGRLK